MKQAIKGEELKLNNGGISEYYCPRCDEYQLHYHKSGHNRYFCKMCGWKGELKSSTIGSFLRIAQEPTGLLEVIKNK